jgi:hypothetical protein
MKDCAVPSCLRNARHNRTLCAAHSHVKQRNPEKFRALMEGRDMLLDDPDFWVKVKESRDQYFMTLYGRPLDG